MCFNIEQIVLSYSIQLTQRVLMQNDAERWIIIIIITVTIFA